MTAAHCLIGSSSTQAILGAHVLQTVEPTQQRRIVDPSQYRIHAAYNPSNLNNDIAILILIIPATLTRQILTIALAPTGSGTFAGETGIVSGWGRVSDSSNAVSAELRNTNNTIITNAVCGSTFGGMVVASSICMATTGGRGTCNGDFGGPLTIAQEGLRLQVGVASFSASGGCQLGRPTVFARVSSFFAWINLPAQQTYA